MAELENSKDLISVLWSGADILLLRLSQPDFQLI